MSRQCVTGSSSNGNGFLSSGYTPPSSGDPPFSVCGWFKPDQLATDGTDEMGMFKLGSSDADGYRLRIDDASVGNEFLQMTTRANGGSSNVGLTTNPDPQMANLWHAFACRFVATNDHRFTAHVELGGSDGFLTITEYTASGTATDPGTINRLALGLLNSGATHFDHLSGLISTYGIWDIDIGDAAALAFCQGLHPTGIRPDSLYGFYPLTELVESDAAVDHIGGQNVPTVTTIGTSPPYSSDEPPVFMPTPIVVGRPVVAVTPSAAIPAAIMMGL